MKLRCIGRYRNDRIGVAYVVGDVFDADEARAKYLFADSPGCFEEVTEVTEPEDKSVSKPARNKMVVSAENK